MTNYEVLTNYNPSNKVKFTIENMDKFVIDHGAYTLWEKSYLCPCRNKETGSPSQNCPRCRGVGFSYLEAEPTLLLYQNQDKGVTNGDVSLAHAGTAIATTARQDKIAFRDRLTVLDSVIPQSLLVYVSKESVESGIYLRYSVVDVTHARTDSEVLSNVRVEHDFYYPDPSLVGQYVSLNLEVVLRYYVIDVLKESRYQYTTDPRKVHNTQRQGDRVQLTRKLLLRREDMYVPDMISDNVVSDKDSGLDLRENLDSGLGEFFG